MQDPADRGSGRGAEVVGGGDEAVSAGGGGGGSEDGVLARGARVYYQHRA